MLDDPSYVLIRHSFGLDELSDQVGIEAHILASLDGLGLASVSEVISCAHHLSHFVLHLVPDNQLSSVSHLLRQWLDLVLSEVFRQLSGNLGQDLPGEPDGVP